MPGKEERSPIVVKVGGSLYDLPDLGERLGHWLSRSNATSSTSVRRHLLVPGGGPAADVIRAYHHAHRLGEETSHWLALRMLAVNAHFLAGLLPCAQVTADPRIETPLAILDMHAFALADDAEPDHVPHRWNATSDSLAVRVAYVAGAAEVMLLKSVEWSGNDWTAAAQAGVVDGYFPEAVRHAPGVRVRIVNLRNNRA